MNILIVGKSDLARALKPLCYSHLVTTVGRPDYDLTKQADCDEIIQQYNPDCVVLTQGVLGGDTWNQITVNYTSTVYLIEGFYRKMSRGQIIAVSSATVNWQSWPGISFERMTYSATKEALSNYCMHLNRKNIPAENEKPVSIQVYEPNAFASRMSNSAESINSVAKELRMLIDNPRISVLRGLNRVV